ARPEAAAEIAARVLAIARGATQA
ncbi:MAG: hypothetical protein AVDCRST_MAG11-2634, partial [uncultured Gemmatimonadaceae bacterium]